MSEFSLKYVNHTFFEMCLKRLIIKVVPWKSTPFQTGWSTWILFV